MIGIVIDRVDAFIYRLDEVADTYDYEAHRLIPKEQLVSSVRQHYSGEDTRFSEYAKSVFDPFEVEGNIPSEQILEVIQRAKNLAPLLYE